MLLHSAVAAAPHPFQCSKRCWPPNRCRTTAARCRAAAAPRAHCAQTWPAAAAAAALPAPAHAGRVSHAARAQPAPPPAEQRRRLLLQAAEAQHAMSTGLRRSADRLWAGHTGSQVLRPKPTASSQAVQTPPIKSDLSCRRLVDYADVVYAMHFTQPCIPQQRLHVRAPLLHAGPNTGASSGSRTDAYMTAIRAEASDSQLLSAGN